MMASAHTHISLTLFPMLSILYRAFSQKSACHVIQVILLLGSVRLGLSEDASLIRCGLAWCRENETCIGPGPDHSDSDCYHCMYLKDECGTSEQRPRCHLFCEDLLLGPLRDEIQRLKDDAKMTLLATKNEQHRTYAVAWSLSGCILMLVAFIVFLKRHTIRLLLQRSCQAKPKSQGPSEAINLLSDAAEIVDETANNVVKMTAETGTQTDIATTTPSTPVQAQEDDGSCQRVSSNTRVTRNSIHCPANATKHLPLTDSMFSEQDTSLKSAQSNVTRSEPDLNLPTYEKVYTSDVTSSATETADKQS